MRIHDSDVGDDRTCCRKRDNAQRKAAQRRNVSLISLLRVSQQRRLSYMSIQLADELIPYYLASS